ncbi:MAG: hypothetical protein AAFY02_13900 [Pseudomonadota bacterium]
MDKTGVKTLQSDLVSLGYGLLVDGEPGPETRKAVQAALAKRRRAALRAEDLVDGLGADAIKQAAEDRRASRRMMPGVLARQGTLAAVGTLALIEALSQSLDEQRERLTSGDWVQVALGGLALTIPLYALAKHIWTAGLFGNKG